MVAKFLYSELWGLDTFWWGAIFAGVLLVGSWILSVFASFGVAEKITYALHVVTAYLAIILAVVFGVSAAALYL